MSQRTPNPSRVVLDVSASLRWAGTPIGIVRVERELVRWMLANVSIAERAFVFFDPDRQNFRTLNPAYEPSLLSGDATIDITGLSDPTRSNKHFFDRIPAFGRPAARWVLRFPHMLLQTLERARLSTNSASARHLIDVVQRSVMSAKQHATMVAKGGARRPYLPVDLACGDEYEFTAKDVLLSVGSGWLHMNVCAVRELKLQTGFRFVLLSHDIIPLLFPQFFRAHDVDAFRRFYEVAIPLCDLIIFSTRTGERDARKYFAQHDLSIGRSAIAAMGMTSFEKAHRDQPLPDNLTRERYILFVSTIEPRKGHEFVYDVWLRLIAAGVPATTGFKLVFVGRQGWQMEGFLERLQSEPKIEGSLLVLSGASDNVLASLYANAAFCIYPSMYEGYGLPLVETFAYGKTLISSSGGALAEVAGEFALCLDPKDGEAWYRALKAWMEDPQPRRAYELAIRERFSHPTWADTSRRLVRLARSLNDEEGLGDAG